MKNLKLMVAILTIGQAIQAQVIDDRSWDQVSKEKRIPILTEITTIQACQLESALAAVADAFKPAGPNDNEAYNNQEKMLKAIQGNKALNVALRSYCANKYYSNLK